MATLTNDAINTALKRVEEDFPVESWVIDGVRAWPLIKADIASESFRAGRAVVGQAVSRRPRMRDRFPFRPALEMLETNRRWLRARVRDQERNADRSPRDVVFYSDGASFVKIGGKFYERFCDPLREELAHRDKTAVMVTPLREFHAPRHASSIFIQSRLDTARLIARAKNQIVRRHDSTLPGFDEAMSSLRADLPGAPIGDRHRYGRLIPYLEAYVSVFDKLLDALRPQVVFIVCYYAIEPMALIRACRARGIVTVDLQHGTINDSHYAYAGVHRFPPGGFDLLPDACWVWSTDEEVTLRRWTRDDPHAPRVIIGGNPFLETWRNERVPFVRDAGDRVRAIIAKQPQHGLQQVMFTAQGYERAEDLERLANAIRATQDRFFWWIRLHPANPGAKSTVDAALARSGAPKSFIVQSHTDIPLYGVLKFMDVHVTHSSSTVIEAAAFGVPSVLTSPGEAIMYKAQVASGWAIVVSEQDDLVQALDRQLQAREALRAAHPLAASSTSAVNAALDALNL